MQVSGAATLSVTALSWALTLTIKLAHYMSRLMDLLFVWLCFVWLCFVLRTRFFLVFFCGVRVDCFTVTLLSTRVLCPLRYACFSVGPQCLPDPFTEWVVAAVPHR